MPTQSKQFDSPPISPSKIIGASVPRIDGPLKTSGTARYASDYHFPRMVYAVPVCSTIANGRIRYSMPRKRRRCPAFCWSCIRATSGRCIASLARDETVRADRHSKIMWFLTGVSMSPWRLRRRWSKRRAQRRLCEYSTMHKRQTYPLIWKTNLKQPMLRANVETPIPPLLPRPCRWTRCMALRLKPIIRWRCMRRSRYGTAEIHAVRIVSGCRQSPECDGAGAGVEKENVQVISKFIGSGFGGKLFPWPHSALAAAASRQLGRPVKLTLTRKMMFTDVDTALRLASECVSRRPTMANSFRFARTIATTPR